MARQKPLICLESCTVRVARQDLSYEKGERFTANRWYTEQLLENHADKFAVWTEELEAELNKPSQSAGQKPARKTAAKAKPDGD